MILFLVGLLTATFVSGADGKLLVGKRSKRSVGKEDKQGEVIHRCLTPRISERITFPLERDKPWSLPNKALAANYVRDIHILVLRYNFRYEETDNENTTGRGLMDLSTDSAAFFNSYGHYIDPPPHDSAYFDAHMKALSIYYKKVSEGKVNLTWDIFPPTEDSVYTLPNEMGHYGACTDTIAADDQLPEIVRGLEHYFIDCLRLADTTSPEIDFSQYESIFLFHAGSDQQNNIGFPNTCSDMYTGFIRFGDSIQADDGTVFLGGVGVDNDSVRVRTALMMPETASQDNRATALNAVIAHEFGHQLGLVDLYRTGAFRTQLGDFALMDDNGFGTGIDFAGFTVGQTFGVNPVYPCAWSRAYLGFVDVVEFRKGSDIRLVAAEIESDGTKVARIPISDDEYYLIENRLQEIDNKTTYIIADPQTSVIMGPGDTTKTLTGEYDHLMGGSGVIIYHVDESVARSDWGGNRGVNNFYDNQLQLDSERRFISIVEADGIVDFGGYYNAGYGSDDDLYRDDRNDKLTPDTNPPSIDNTGNNSHVHITNITRDSVLVGFSHQKVDSVIFFDVKTDGLVDGFPLRAGYPVTVDSFLVATLDPLDPYDTLVLSFTSSGAIGDDLDKDGTDEIIVASGNTVSAVMADRTPFMQYVTGCVICSTYTDLSYARYDDPYPNYTDSAIHARESVDTLAPLFFTPLPILTGPVSGDFGEADSSKLVAVGTYVDLAEGLICVNSIKDADGDALGDSLFWFRTDGWPTDMIFGDVLYVTTTSIVGEGHKVYFSDNAGFAPLDSVVVEAELIQGAALLGENLVLLATEGSNSSFILVNGPDSSVTPVTLPLYCELGPAIADLDRDSILEIVAASLDGNLVSVSIDTTGGGFTPIGQPQMRQTGYVFDVRPIVGDVDLDGYADIVIGGAGHLYAFDDRLLDKLDFPKLASDRFPDDELTAPAVMAEMDNRGLPELIFPTIEGNIYALSDRPGYGFPLSAGERSYSSSLIMADATGAKLGYLGDDGWFYLWDFWAGDFDNDKAFWPMGGADPSGSYRFDNSKLGTVSTAGALLDKERFFAWPNPVTDGNANIRYYLGREAERVTLAIYDLSGNRIVEIDGSRAARENEESWECSDVTPGIYRCVIEVEADGKSDNGFIDIAIIR